MYFKKGSLQNRKDTVYCRKYPPGIQLNNKTKLHWREFDKYINGDILKDPTISCEVKYLENFAHQQNSLNNKLLKSDYDPVLNSNYQQNNQLFSDLELKRNIFCSQFGDSIDFAQGKVQKFIFENEKDSLMNEIDFTVISLDF